MFKKVLCVSLLLVGLIIMGCQNSKTTNSTTILETSTLGTTTTTEHTNTTTTLPVPKEVVIEDIVLVTDDPKQFERVEFALYGDSITIKREGNPFNYEYLNITGTFISPSGKTIILPAFWTRDYEISLDTNYKGTPSGLSGVPSTNPNEIQGRQVITWKGEEHYRLRFLPEESGTWRLIVTVMKNGVIVQANQKIFEVNENAINFKGFIQIEPKHKHNFVFQNGELFIPLGQNTAWYTSSTRRTYDYDVWFSKMHENGANAARIWLATWGFSLHWGSNYDEFRLDRAAELDRVLDLAQEYDIFILLTLINHGQFSANVNAEWSKNPWNVINGGILSKPNQFFYNKKAKDTYKSQLLYIIGRYGYSSNIIAWELWNEVDWTDDFNTLDVRTWHREMTEFIKNNDPYNHLVSTSFKGETHSIYTLNLLDFTNPHSYGYASQNINATLPNRIKDIWESYQKPVFYSEIGINWENGAKTTQADPTGISIHQQNWAGMMSGAVGGAMNWWWDSWVHPNDLYYRFKGASVFAKELNLLGDSYELLSDLDISISNNKVDILGYKVDNRIYGYLYDIDWKHDRPSIGARSNVTVTLPLASGSYTLRIFDTVTGEVIQTESLNVTNQVVLTIPAFQFDYAFIIE
ncbi:MAG: hypothetical protein GX490_10315 [Bacilli bacterium]|nr:hypothetical protein [Bacilli bacterium]